MSTVQAGLLASEAEFERRQKLLLRGIELISECGSDVFADPFRADAHLDYLTPFDVEAYAFASEYDAANEGMRVTSPVGKSTPIRVCQQANASPQAPLLDDELLTHAIDNFYTISLRSVKNGTAESSRAKSLVFRNVVAGSNAATMKLSELTANHLRMYVDILPKLPIKVRTDDLRPLEQIIADPRPKLSPKTVFSHAQVINSLLKHCVKRGYPVPLGFEGILEPLLKKPKVSKSQQQRHAFADNELQMYFGNDKYRNASHARASDCLLPLLALYTGAGEAELCQLNVADVYQSPAEGRFQRSAQPVTGFWVIDINEADDKSLKNDNRIRLVPLHPRLIELGFLSFVEQMKKCGQTRLFPNEQRNRRGEFSAFSKRFNRYLNDCGVTERAKNFHSFRHTLQTRLIDRGVEEYVVEAIVGHDFASRGQALKSYAPNGANLQTKHEKLSELDFPLDFAALRRSVVAITAAQTPTRLDTLNPKGRPDK